MATKEFSHKRNFGLTLGALGVVYGDSGTSPLYAVRESALAAGGQVPSASAIMGAVSLIFWSLLLVVTVKYIIVIMRADNDGEGGVLALAALAHRSPGPGPERLRHGGEELVTPILGDVHRIQRVIAVHESNRRPGDMPAERSDRDAERQASQKLLALH